METATRPSRIQPEGVLRGDARRHSHRAGLFRRVLFAGHRGPQCGADRVPGHAGELHQQRLGGRVRRVHPHRRGRGLRRGGADDADRQRAVSPDELRAEPSGWPPARPWATGCIIGYDVTDELFGICRRPWPGSLNPFYAYGAIAAGCRRAWAVGTAVWASCAWAACCPLRAGQRPERGALRHVPRHHHSPGPEE